MYREEKAAGEKALPSIDSIPVVTHDEAVRQMCVTHLRKYVMSDLPKDMRTVYDTAVEPGIRARTGKSPQDARAVRKAMQPVTFYRTWSSLRYNAQDMTWSSVQGEVERALP